jgi:hypothetical protein
VAARDGVPRDDWDGAVGSAERFAAAISCDGTDVQALLRGYLRKPAAAPARAPELNPALLRFDAEGGLATVTPLEDLLSAARAAVAAHIGEPRGVCVALQAPARGRAPEARAETSMFSAIWWASPAAASRLILPRVKIDRAAVPARSPPDSRFRVAMEALARERAMALHQGLSAQAWRAAVAELNRP